MSWRAQRGVRPVAAGAARLSSVLGVGVETGAQPHCGSIRINGVDVSTDANHWTPLTVKQATKLLLNPEHKELIDTHGYSGTLFYTSACEDFREFSFWVHMTDNYGVEETAYYVLARPPHDTNVYRFEQ
tara:strand:+ start:121 stop:507 length:387 start_codon:yes stop_codon:yes gene_type:complete